MVFRRVFFLFVLCLVFAHGAVAAETYNIDTRKYFTSAAERGSWPYNTIVQFVKKDLSERDVFTGRMRPVVFCSGDIKNSEYVLSAGHCADAVGSKVDMQFYSNSQKTPISGTVVWREENGAETDMLIVKIDEPDEETKNALASMKFHGVAATNPSVGTNVTTIGYGSLRIMSDQDLARAKQMLLDYFDSEIGKANLKKQGISHADPNEYKLNKDLTALDFLNEKMVAAGRPAIYPDSANPKYDKNCEVTRVKSNGVVNTNCLSWTGDSGMPVLASDNYTQIGLHFAGTGALKMFEDRDILSYAMGPSLFYDILMGYIRK